MSINLVYVEYEKEKYAGKYRDRPRADENSREPRVEVEKILSPLVCARRDEEEGDESDKHEEGKGAMEYCERDLEGLVMYLRVLGSVAQGAGGHVRDVKENFVREHDKGEPAQEHAFMVGAVYDVKNRSSHEKFRDERDDAKERGVHDDSIRQLYPICSAGRARSRIFCSPPSQNPSTSERATSPKREARGEGRNYRVELLSKCGGIHGAARKLKSA